MLRAIAKDNTLTSVEWSFSRPVKKQTFEEEDDRDSTALEVTDTVPTTGWVDWIDRGLTISFVRQILGYLDSTDEWLLAQHFFSGNTYSELSSRAGVPRATLQRMMTSAQKAFRFTMENWHSEGMAAVPTHRMSKARRKIAQVIARERCNNMKQVSCT
jgi:hypothetical protein